MQVWQTILNVIIFILCLSFVVCIHELGHFTVAKICKVYCFEFSIGFGPALFKHKFKHKVKKNEKGLPSDAESVTAVDEEGNPLEVLSVDSTKAPDKNGRVEGETAFVIRALPLGGYVSMAGEETDGEEGILVPKNRTIGGINHFKQICIMLAGITMNFILAFILFLADFTFCPQTMAHADSNAINVASSTDTVKYAASEAGLKTGDKILTLYQKYEGLTDKNNNPVSFEFPSADDRNTITSYQSFTTGSTSGTYDELEHSSIAYASQDVIARNFDDKITDMEAYKDYLANSNSTRTFYITYEDLEGNTKTLAPVKVKASEVKSNDTLYYVFEKLGISVYTSQFYFSAGEAWGQAGNTFGNLFTGIYKALGGLFTPEGWQNVGGIVSVYRMSAQGTTSGSAGYFLLLWGYISLNLGCFNLLPFPGLDGWQTLISLLESIFRKKFSDKFKNIANNVGLIVMLALAVLLVVKDFVIPL